MLDIENIEKHDLRFEITKVESTTAQLIRNIEQFYDSAIIVIRPGGSLDYFNSRAVDLFELNSEPNTETFNLKDLLSHLAKRGDFGPGNPESFVALASRVLMPSADSPQHFGQSYLTMPSGNVLRILLYRNTDGSLTLSAHDVSVKRRNENMLEIALDIGLAGYLVFDTVAKSCRIESRYMSNLLTAEEKKRLETSGPSSFFHPDDFPRSQEMWDTVRKTGGTESATLRLITKKEGVRWFRFVLMPESESPKITRIVSFFNDVTDTLRQQENLRKAKLLAEESLITKENFLARMSHEIRTPMNAVIGITDALIHHHADTTISSELDLIQKSATSILKMLDETLTHSRLDADSFSLNPAPASPIELVKDACALWEQQALKSKAKIRCIIKGEIPDEIIFDKYRYEQCINNLLSNAVKFAHGGKIDVILTVVEKTPQNSYLVLAVKDTGIGMTPEQQSRIFDAYKQADQSISSRFGGTGLGMNITKQIIERMGGSISVRSEIGLGTMFAMSVPIVEVEKETAQKEVLETVQSTTPAIEIMPTPDLPEPIDVTSTGLVDKMLVDAQPAPTPYSDLHILVVDDNPTNHIVIKSLLGSVVGAITLASNGAEALKILDNSPIDIVLMDIHMPVMDGIECTLAIRSSDKVWKDVTIIALTADPQYQQKNLCKNIGMDEALAKPVRLTDLLEAMDAVLPYIDGQAVCEKASEAYHAS